MGSGMGGWMLSFIRGWWWEGGGEGALGFLEAGGVER